jgi:PAS domain S-box-containing protein
MVSQTLTISLSGHELEILEAYCQQFHQTELEVVRGCIRSLGQSLAKRPEDPPTEELLAELASLRQELAVLKQEKASLARSLEITQKHCQQRETDLETQAEALREREAHHCAILGAVPDLMLRVLRDGTCLESILPKSARAGRFVPIEKHISEVLPPALLQQQLQAIGQALSTGEVQVYEHQIEKFGSIADEEVRISPLAEDEVLILVCDIAKRKQAERERDRFFDLSLDLLYFFNYSLDLLCIANFDGYFVRLNPSWERLLGYSVQELIAKPYLEFVHPEDRARTIAEAEKLQAGLVTLEFENRYRCRDGSYRWFMWSATSLPDQQAMYCAAHDITERKQAEEALAASEELFRQMAENIKEVFWMADCDLTQILYANPAYEEIWGRTCTSLYEQPRSFADAIYPEDRDRILPIIEQHRQSGWEIEYRIVRPDGAIRWIWEQAFPIQNQAGEIYRLVGVSQDMSERQAALRERQQAEELLRKSEESLKVAQRIARVGNWEFDLATQAVSWSDELFPIYGRDSTQWQPTYLEFQQQVHPDDWQPFEQAIERAITQGIPYDIEHRVIHPDGSMRYALSKGEAVFNERGQVIKLIGTTQDITEFKLAEIALRESEEKFRQLAETIQEIFFIHDAESYELLYISPAFEQIIGIPEASIYQNPTLWQEIVHPDDRDRVNQAWQRELAGENCDREYRIIKPDGDVRWLRVQTFAVCDESGKIVRIAGVARDISDRKVAEEALRLAEENYRSIFENALEGIFQSTPDGHYLRLNPAMATIHGYESPEQMLAKVKEIGEQIYVDPKSRDQFRCLMEAQGAVKNFQYQVYRQDGSRIWVEENTRSVRDVSGNLLYYEGIIQDISQRKQEEEHLKRQVQKLRIEIDQQKRQREVAEVMQTDYFQALQAEVDKLRLNDLNDERVN